ncbi:MAG: HHL1-like protein [Leptolyngbyaceae cyanobacterium bins.349]|nr:HHL1-like protein [Leptolyngbyaceae cyanobacterium bins.349]
MAPSTGFGQPKQPKQPSKSAEKRVTASKQYDKMKSDGLPEFSIFVRVKDKKSWFPIGSLAVNRSNQISRAIYQQEAELLQGAFRLFPVLKKSQNNLEYGYRLKEFPDEPIQVAVRPTDGAGNPLQGAMQQVQKILGGLFQRKS